MAAIPNHIASLREQRGLSQQALADVVGAHWTTISKLERGRLKLTTEWLYKLARAMDVAPAVLLADNGASIPTDDEAMKVAASPLRPGPKTPSLPVAFQVLLRCLEDNGALRQGQFQDALQRYLFSGE